MPRHDIRGRIAFLRINHPGRAHGGPVPAFGAHPILNDGFWAALFDLSRPAAVQRLADSITHSKEMIGIETFDLDLRYHGDEDVRVPAGTFRCRAFSTQMPARFELAERQVP